MHWCWSNLGTPALHGSAVLPILVPTMRHGSNAERSCALVNCPTLQQCTHRCPAPQTLSSYGTPISDAGSFVDQAVAGWNTCVGVDRGRGGSM